MSTEHIWFDSQNDDVIDRKLTDGNYWAHGKITYSVKIIIKMMKLLFPLLVKWVQCSIKIMWLCEEKLKNSK